MTELGASMIATLEHTPTETGADMFGLKAFIDGTWAKSERSKPALCRLAFGCLSLSVAASLATLVTTTVERDSANPHALRRFFTSLVANSLRGCSTTAAFDGDRL